MPQVSPLSVAVKDYIVHSENLTMNQADDAWNSITLSWAESDQPEPNDYDAFLHKFRQVVMDNVGQESVRNRILGQLSNCDQIPTGPEFYGACQLLTLEDKEENLSDSLQRLIERIQIPTIPNLEREPIPRWRQNLDVVELSPEDYTYELGAQGRNPSRAQRIIPNTDRIVEIIQQGKNPCFNWGRRIFLRGGGHADVTQRITLQFSQGNHWMQFGEESFICTEPNGSVNTSCPHLSRNGYSINRFCLRDVALTRDNLINDIKERLGFDLVLYLANNTITLTPHGENGILTDEELSGLLYECYGRTNYEYIDILSNNARILVKGTFSGSWELADPQGSNVYEQLINDPRFPLLLEHARLTNDSSRQAMDSWEINPTTRTSLLELYPISSHSYREDLDQFVSDYRAAELNAEQGNPIRFINSSVTNGTLSPREGNGSRGFGVELEFLTDRSNSSSQIAQELYRRGMTDEDHQVFYHYSDEYNCWWVEDDCSVDGEAVSPILYDNEESWGQIQTVCSIIRSNGGRISHHAGSHIHIGAENLSLQQRRGIFFAVCHHQDTLMRLATCSGRQHRAFTGNSYANPFSPEAIRYYDINSIGMGLHRSSVVNFENENTIEFRAPDCTLDPGHIQANVMFAAALVKAGQSFDPARVRNNELQRVGSSWHRKFIIESSNVSEDEKLVLDNISLILSLDSLFSTREEKLHILDAIVRSTWQHMDSID